MGDIRFEAAYDAVAQASDRASAIRGMDDESVIAALAAATRAKDPLLANILATEAENRIRRLRASLAHMQEGVAILDPDGRILWLNPSAETLLGVRREDATGKHLHVLVDHRDLSDALVPHEECAILSAARTGVAVEREEEIFVRLDNSRLCVAYTSSPTRQRDGEISGSVLVFRDCTQRRRNEEALLEAQQRYQSLFDHLPIPVVSLDARGTILDMNPAAEKLTRRARSEGRGHSFLAFLRAEEAADIVTLFREVVAGERRWTPFDLLRGDGTYVRAEALGIPVHDATGVVRIHCLVQAPATTSSALLQEGMLGAHATNGDVGQPDAAAGLPAPPGAGTRMEPPARANVETGSRLPRP